MDINFDISTLIAYLPYQIFGNIALTIPLGILLIFLTNYTLAKRIFVTVVLCVSIEIIQLLLIIMLHLPYRTFDINDIILNIFGGIIGVIIFYLCSLLYIKLPAKNKNSSYFHMVCQNSANHRKSLSQTPLHRE